MGIAVVDHRLVHEFALMLQALDDVLIRGLDVASRVIRNLSREPALFVHGARHRQPFSLPHTIVILAKPRRNVHDSGAVFGGNKVAKNHPERPLRSILCEIRE